MPTRCASAIGATPVTVRLHVDDTDVAQGAPAGAILERAAKDKCYGERSGVIRDPFGHLRGRAQPRRSGGHGLRPRGPCCSPAGAGVSPWSSMPNIAIGFAEFAPGDFEEVRTWNAEQGVLEVGERLVGDVFRRVQAPG